MYAFHLIVLYWTAIAFAAWAVVLLASGLKLLGVPTALVLAAAVAALVGGSLFWMYVRRRLRRARLEARASARSDAAAPARDEIGAPASAANADPEAVRTPAREAR